MTTPSTPGIKHFLLLFFPLTGTALLSTLFPFLEKILLGRYSLEAMEASVAASNVLNIVKIPTVAAAFIAQVHIARFAGAQTYKEMGPCIWQMIWFSLLSMLITIPTTLIYGHYYFIDTHIRALALPYLYIMTAGNFLFPLGAALSCFYLGNKRGKELLKITFLVQSLGFLLCYICIFGIPSILPPHGLLGAAIAFLSTQLLLCITLFLSFLKSPSSHAPTLWQLRPHLLWEYLRPGLARCISSGSVMLSWSVLAYIVIHKGDDFLLILTIGCAVWEIFSVLTEGLLQLITTETSHILGSKTHSLLNYPFRIGLLFVLGISTALSIPLLLFPHLLFPACFPALTLSPYSLSLLGFGLWICFTLDAFNVIGVAYILSFKDTFQLLMRAILTWIFETGCAYLILKNFSISSPHLWIAISPGLLLIASSNFLRARYLKRQYTTALAVQ